jgi:hypothetical protein
MLNKTCHGMSRATTAGALALVVLAGPAAADEADARAILAAMSDYMSAQQTFSFDFDSTLEVVTTEDQKIALASSGTVAVARPGLIHARRQGGFADMEMAYDGIVFTLIGHNANVYAEVALEGTIDSMIDTLRNDHGVVLPAADLLMANPAEILMDGVTDVKDLGSGVIGGQECDHIALRSDELDLQIWIAQGDAPYPCRYVLSARTVAHQPQYTLQIDDWETDVESDDLTVTIPQDAQGVDLDSITLLSQELPDNFTTGAAK